MTDRPWSKFFWADWRSDPTLRMCSLAARGLWMEMLCLMAEASPRGHLLVNGNAPTDSQLAVLAGAPPDQIAEQLAELESAGVLSRTRAGVIYSRRITRDEKRAAHARKIGKSGGNPALVSIGNKTQKSSQVNPSVKGPLNTQKPEARSQKPEREDDVADAGARDDDPVATPAGRAVRDIVDIDVRTAAGWWSIDGEVARWIAEGCDLSLDILPTIKAAMQRRGAQGPPNSPRYFASAVANARAARLAPMPTPANGGHHVQRQQRSDTRYDDASRREPIAAWVAGRLGAGPEPAGAG